MSAWLSDLLMPSWAKFLNIGISVWNACASLVIDLLMLSPDSVGGGVAWSWITAITGSHLYKACASALVVSFFLYGISKSALDFGKNFDLRYFLKFLLPMCLAEVVLLNFATLVKMLFEAAAALVQGTNAIMGVSSEVAQIEPMDATIINLYMHAGGDGIFDSLLTGLLAFIAMIVMIICGIGLVVTAYSRVFKMLQIVPLGCFALPAAAAADGISELRNPASNYIRTFVVYMLEAVAIMFAVYLCSSLLVGANIFMSLGGEEDLSSGVYYILDTILVCSATTALAKGAEMTVQKIFG